LLKSENPELTAWIVDRAPTTAWLIRVAALGEWGRAARTGLSHAGSRKSSSATGKKAQPNSSRPASNPPQSRLGVHGHRRQPLDPRLAGTLRQAGAASARDADRPPLRRDGRFPAPECDAENGVITPHAVAEKAALARWLKAPRNSSLPRRETEDQGLESIGKAAHRLDIPDKVKGKPLFGINVSCRGMATAAIRAMPVFRGKLASRRRAKRIKGMRGLIKVVQLEDAVAVVADNWWRRTACSSTWRSNGTRRERPARSTESISSSVRSAWRIPHSGGAQRRATSRRPFSSAAKVIEAAYTRPS